MRDNECGSNMMGVPHIILEWLDKFWTANSTGSGLVEEVQLISQQDLQN